MKTEYLTIKELTDAVGGDITPRMVRHYHTLGLLPPAQRSDGNYRLYTHQNIQRSYFTNLDMYLDININVKV